MFRYLILSFGVVLGSVSFTAASAEVVRCDFPNRNSNWVPTWVEFEVVGLGGSAQVRDALSEKFGLPPNRAVVSEGAKSIGLIFTVGPIKSDNGGSLRSHLDFRLSVWTNGQSQLEGKGFSYGEYFTGRGSCK